MQFAARIENMAPSVFDNLNRIRRQLLAQGRQVYDLWIGTPDFPPEPHVMAAFMQAGAAAENYKYSLGDLPEMTQAVINWYQRRYGVALSPEEITSLNGSQEGFAHVTLPLCDYGDEVLVPDPGYPVFAEGPALCGARPIPYPLYGEKGFVLDFADIPPAAAERAKAIVVSYPANPVTSTADEGFYERLVAFAQAYDLIVIHDNAYSELVFDGVPGGSFLAAPGAREVGIEFNSLSKTYNLTGLRIAFALGNREIIQRLKAVRSQIDYGVPLPVQYAAIAALNGSQEGIAVIREQYRQRRDVLCQGLTAIGWPVPPSPATMFVWAPLPPGCSDSRRFAEELLEASGVMCVPGSAFGRRGEGYVRFALTVPAEKILAAVTAIADSGILRQSQG